MREVSFQPGVLVPSHTHRVLGPRALPGTWNQSVYGAQHKGSESYYYVRLLDLVAIIPPDNEPTCTYTLLECVASQRFEQSVAGQQPTHLDIKPRNSQA